MVPFCHFLSLLHLCFFVFLFFTIVYFVYFLLSCVLSRERPPDLGFTGVFIALEQGKFRWKRCFSRKEKKKIPKKSTPA